MNIGIKLWSFKNCDKKNAKFELLSEKIRIAWVEREKCVLFESIVTLE